MTNDSEQDLARRRARQDVIGINFDELQEESNRWRRENFPDTAGQSSLQLLGVVEEVGELSHATLKAIQGIRGTANEHAAAKRDAVGDIIVYLAGYCSAEGISLQDCVEEAWSEVKLRNWIKNTKDGTAESLVEDEEDRPTRTELIKLIREEDESPEPGDRYTLNHLGLTGTGSTVVEVVNSWLNLYFEAHDYAYFAGTFPEPWDSDPSAPLHEIKKKPLTKKPRAKGKTPTDAQILHGDQ